MTGVPEDVFDQLRKDMNEEQARYESQGYAVTRFVPPDLDGCWGCGYDSLGSWWMGVVAALNDEEKHAIVFPLLLCEPCRNDDEKRNLASDRVVDLFHDQKELLDFTGRN